MYSGFERPVRRILPPAGILIRSCHTKAQSSVLMPSEWTVCDAAQYRVWQQETEFTYVYTRYLRIVCK